MLKTSQMFSQGQRLANFMGSMQLPESSLLTSVSASRAKDVRVMLAAFRSHESPGAWGVR